MYCVQLNNRRTFLKTLPTERFAMASKGIATATGCYKCGQPGHWSKDCPFEQPLQPSPAQATNQTPAGGPSRPSNANRFNVGQQNAGAGDHPDEGLAESNVRPVADGGSRQTASVKAVAVKKKRPKLTAELLLSDVGLPYVIKTLPQQVKLKGPGHEVRERGHTGAALVLTRHMKSSRNERY